MKMFSLNPGLINPKWLILWLTCPLIGKFGGSIAAHCTSNHQSRNK